MSDSSPPSNTAVSLVLLAVAIGLAVWGLVPERVTPNAPRREPVRTIGKRPEPATLAENDWGQALGAPKRRPRRRLPPPTPRG